MKRYTLIVEHSEDSSEENFNIRSCNEGFNALELLGILTHKINDIHKQMAGEIKPDFVERTVMKESEEQTNE